MNVGGDSKGKVWTTVEWQMEKKPTIMNNDIITQKHFYTQAVIKWKIIWFFNLDISFVLYYPLSKRLPHNYLLISFHHN